MITKYNTYNNEKIKYLSDGKYSCPVCDKDDFKKTQYYEYIECSCNNCSYNWIQNTNDIFRYATDLNKNNIKNGDDIIDHDLIDIKLNKKQKYLSNGDTMCPYCGDLYFELDSTEIHNDGTESKFICNMCNNKWINSYQLEIEISKDILENTIIVGDIIPENTYNKNKWTYNNYYTAQLNKKQTDFNI